MVEVGATDRHGGATSAQLMDALDIRKAEDLDDLLRDLISDGYVVRLLPSSISGRPTYNVELAAYRRLIARLDEDQSPAESSSNRSVSLTDAVDAEIIPAADRLVSLDHNQPEYVEVRDGLENLREALRSINDLPERDRLLKSLNAAISLWEAVELKIIQVKVGLIMAIEDAGKALAATAKAVATAVLVDVIKSLVKTKTGIDLDKL